MTDSFGSTLGATAAFLVGRTVSIPFLVEIIGGICDGEYSCLDQYRIAVYNLNICNTSVIDSVST